MAPKDNPGVLTATVDQLQKEVDGLKTEVACLAIGVIALLAMLVALELKIGVKK